MVRDALVCYSIAVLSIRVRSVNRWFLHTIYRVYFINWGPQILLRHKVWSWGDVLESEILRRSSKLVVHHVCDRVVRDEMVGYTADGDADGLLDKTFLFEAVRIDQ